MFIVKTRRVSSELTRLVATVTAPETSWNSDRENRERNEDRSRNDPHPERGTLVNKSPH